MKAGMISLGCSKNQVDSEMILGLLENNNFEITSSVDECDLIIINTCGFINASKRFKELNDYNYKDSVKFDNFLRNYSTCPILIIDDFGNEVKNDVVRDGVLLQILNARASKRLFTIFTSDFSIDEIVDLYSTSKAATPRANQIGKIIKGFAKEEINLGDISLY